MTLNSMIWDCFKFYKETTLYPKNVMLIGRAPKPLNVFCLQIFSSVSHTPLFLKANTLLYKHLACQRIFFWHLKLQLYL